MGNAVDNRAQERHPDKYENNEKYPAIGVVLAEDMLEAGG